ESAERVVATAKRTNKKLVIGYILRHHPSWVKFIEIAQKLGTPLVFRMNLNQQSNGETWAWHKRLMDSFPPIVDCGVHYVDVMCQMTKAKPVKVHAVGARLTNEVQKQNYGMLQVTFDDGSVGWYEAGWGPMMSETAFFVKDGRAPKGAARTGPGGGVRAGRGAALQRVVVRGETRPRPEGLGLDRPRGGRPAGPLRRHQRAHADEPDP